MVDLEGCWGSHIRNLYLFVTLRAVIQGMHLHEGLAAWSNNADVEKATPRSSLAYLLTDKLNKNM